MSKAKPSLDWRVPFIWAVMLSISVFAHAYVEMADNKVSLAQAVALEVTSHVMVAAMLPAVYWLHRHRPISGGSLNLAIHVTALVPFSFIRTTGMTGLRLLWFVGILGEHYSFPLTLDRLLYELSKDVVNYALLSGAVVAIQYLLERADARTQPVPVIVDPPPAAVPETARPERFAVRKRGGSEVVVDVADIDWIEAAGNYAILHVGGETFEIRSSLTKLEGELDPRRFVRVHKSHLVNIAQVAEVTPWVSGDWRIRLQDGAEVNLSRRYRQRFEALAPVRS
ncbi:MAG TPA: LytTR family DNA-binding domain-containing protein [Reyranella sp.]|jgi:hypothetical protein|nr:LytTR family DNA-binding domain-containing protein [Reyranella sp.]